MDREEFDELLDSARQIGKVLSVVFNDVTGEDLDMESVVRHYPLVALGVAAGIGALGGWWVGRKSRPQLPPPPARTGVDDVLDRVRRVLPEAVADDAAAMARNWVDDLEPRLKEGLETVVSNMSEGRFGAFLRGAMQRMDPGDEHRLEDPDEPKTT
jgi:hypothetical protein